MGAPPAAGELTRVGVRGSTKSCSVIKFPSFEVCDESRGVGTLETVSARCEAILDQNKF
jgi:hypothetical protein